MLNQNIHNRIYYYLFIALAFCIPLNRVLSPYIIGLLVLNWMLEGRFRHKLIRLTSSWQNMDVLLFTIIYVCYAIGLLYTSNLEYGYFSMQVKVSLLIFPVMFATIDSSEWSQNKTLSVFTGFIIGSFTSSLICLYYAFNSYLITGDVKAFYYISLSVIHHPSYSAMYMSFSIAILIWFLIEGIFMKRNWLIAFILILIVYFHIFTVMLSSKAGIIALILIFFLTVSYVIFVNRRYFFGSLLIVAITILFIAVFNFFPHSSTRFYPSKEIIQNKKEITNETTDGTVERVLIWKYSFEVINDHFFFGVGTGDVINSLVEVYDDHNFISALQQELNPHNQYLQTFISLGVIGFLVLILSLLLPAVYSAWYKGFIYFCFLVIIAFNFLVESMLERQAGVVFYAFFNSFLFMLYLPPRKVE